MKERRRWPRLPLAIPVFVRGSGLHGGDILEFGTIVNVSAGGVLLISRKYLEELSQIFLEIPVGFTDIESFAQAQRKFQARVLRVIRTDKSYWCAARFKRPLHLGKLGWAK